ncbi:MAG TPA: Gfo/Idh/MocA family oxidoreductase [Acidobacteriaceae bacterium]
MITRREFGKGMAAAAAGFAVASTAKSYAQIVGANERVRFATIGLNGRAYAHLSSIHANADTARMVACADVESNILAKFAAEAQKELGYSVESARDFRRLLERKDIDAVSIATPDHWHTPMAILALEAGKHVYVEKPCSHNPAEGALLMEAVRKYSKQVQMGTQQRSSPHTIEVVGRIHGGEIGRPYYAKAWYVNTRKSIGHGKPAAVPATLDWDLWQGPAPHTPYRDNVQPYSWHWFRVWGTGETLNNGTHEVDVCRWALGVEYPQRVSAQGGRYAFQDDWQFYDTLVTEFTYSDKALVWEGRSCNGAKMQGRDRGSQILGTTGSVLVDRDGYEVYDRNGKKTSEFRVQGEKTSSADLVGRDSMTDAHFANFIAGVTKGEPLHAPIAVGNVAVTMLQLSNIAWEVGRELQLDPAQGGKIVNDAEAMQGWGRTYEPGWEPKV